MKELFVKTRRYFMTQSRATLFVVRFMWIVLFLNFKSMFFFLLISCEICTQIVLEINGKQGEASWNNHVQLTLIFVWSEIYVICFIWILSEWFLFLLVSCEIFTRIILEINFDRKHTCLWTDVFHNDLIRNNL